MRDKRKLAGALAASLVLTTLVALQPAAGATQVSRAAVAGSVRTAVLAQVPPPTVVDVYLCAKRGTLKANGDTLDIWGFALLNDTCANSVATVPGPTIDVVEGTQLNIHLTNDLSQKVGMIFPGQNGEQPNYYGPGPGQTKTYSFTVGGPGTYIYESLFRPLVHIGMGLYGPLIVRPANCGDPAGCENYAYNDLGSQFDAEALVVLSEMDPNLNVQPSAFDLNNWHPVYWFINGKAYPKTLPIELGGTPGTSGARRLLIRYINAGQDNLTMSLLGLHQRLLAKDAYLLGGFAFDAVAQTIPAGSTADAIVEIPDGGGTFPLYNRQLHLNNVDDFPGGMLTFIEAPPVVTP